MEYGWGSRCPSCGGQLTSGGCSNTGCWSRSVNGIPPVLVCGVDSRDAEISRLTSALAASEAALATEKEEKLGWINTGIDFKRERDAAVARAERVEADNAKLIEGDEFCRQVFITEDCPILRHACKHCDSQEATRETARIDVADAIARAEKAESHLRVCINTINELEPERDAYLADLKAAKERTKVSLSNESHRADDLVRQRDAALARVREVENRKILVMYAPPGDPCELHESKVISTTDTHLVVRSESLFECAGSAIAAARAEAVRGFGGYLNEHDLGNVWAMGDVDEAVRNYLASLAGKEPSNPSESMAQRMQRHAGEEPSK
jgi:hypothetical protein